MKTEALLANIFDRIQTRINTTVQVRKMLKKYALNCFKELWLKNNIQGNLAEYIKIANMYEKYRSDTAVLCIMETLLALAPEMNVFDMKKSEMRVQSSFIHNFVKSIFKKDCLHSPHCSNTVNNFYSTRPDYLVDVWSSSTSLYVNAFGECKPAKATVDSCHRDIYRLALFCQIATKEKKLESAMSFFSKDNHISFYMMKRMNGLYFLINVATVVVPTTEEMMPTMSAFFDEIGELRRLYADYCHMHSDIEDNIKTLPWSVLQKMTSKKSKESSSNKTNS